VALAPATRLGPYEVIAQIGAGGMGEVYRARDTKLNRDVALKILPEAFTLDGDRIARFRREAQVLASLNHPNIAAIYGFEDSGSTHALVLELVEGPTLADRIAKGPIPLDETLPIAKQIAEALEAAHEQGIIHRDLKPANIKLRADGSVKVLDFGLAKAMDAPAAISPMLTASPTITTPAQMTGVGMILGTAAYMSPEQAKGRPADKRSDVWAFGCVLYEMLTGKRAFDGEDLTDTIAAVVKSEPVWSVLPDSTPPHIRLLLRQCLQKDRRSRIAEVGTVKFLLNPAPELAAAAGAAPTLDGGRKSWALPRVVSSGVGLCALIGVTAYGTWAWTRNEERAPQPVRFSIAPPKPLAIVGTDPEIAISPDGRRIIYRATTPEGRTQLVVLAVDELEGRPLTDTAGARFPFVSPDNRWIGFFAGSQIKKMPIAGGAPIVVCGVTSTPRGATWGPDDTIVFATSDATTGLLAVPAAGGNPKVLTQPDIKHSEDHWYPSFLPDGRAVLFTIVPVDRSSTDQSQIALLDLKTGETRVLIRGGSYAKYAYSGHLLYAAGGTVRAVRFDISSHQVGGEPTPIAEPVLVGQVTATAQFAVSRSGTFVYVPGTTGAQSARSLVWVSRRGLEQPIDAPVRPYMYLRISPDGTRVALDIRDEQSDIWVWDIARQTLTPLTLDPATDRNPVWTPDSRRIVFASTRDGRLDSYWQAADGTGSVERLTSPATGKGGFHLPMSVTPDGTRLLLNMGGDIGLVPLPTPGVKGEHKQQVLFQTPFTEDNAEISPDGRWLAYQSNDSGDSQIYVRPFPNVDGGRWQVSVKGGVKPAWAPKNGRELFYIAPNNAFMAVPVLPSTTSFARENPIKLFDAPYYYSAANRTYDVSPDGQRFLMIKDKAAEDASKSTPSSAVVVLNWFEELKRIVPVK